MSEIGETFAAIREEGKVKRQSNTVASTAILVHKEVKFESKNNGAHLIVTHGTKVVDFWPATGKFISRVSPKNSRGIKNLLKYLGVK